MVALHGLKIENHHITNKNASKIRLLVLINAIEYIVEGIVFSFNGFYVTVVCEDTRALLFNVSMEQNRNCSNTILFNKQFLKNVNKPFNLKTKLIKLYTSWINFAQL